MADIAPNLRELVLARIIEAGDRGLTDDEGEVLTELIHQTYGPRRKELADLGLIVDSGRRRKTRRGRPAAVWVPARLAPKPEGGAA